MSLSSPAVPTPQAPGAVADTQQQYNIGAQAGSNVNQVNPYGSLNYTQTGTGPGGVPIYTATTQLSPAQQQLLNTLQGTQQTAGTAGSQLFANANYGSTDPRKAVGDMTSGLTSQVMAQETAALQPQFTADISHLDTQLRNQGLQPGTPGYDIAMNQLKQSQGQTVSGFLAQAEPQAFSQATQLYQMPATMAQSFAQFGSPTSPGGQNLVPTNALQPANYTGAVANYNQANQAAYQAQLAQQQAMMTGLFGMGGTALGGWAKAGFPGASSIGSMFGPAAAVA